MDHAEALAESLNRRRFEAVRADAAALLEGEGVELSTESLDSLLYELLRTRVVAVKRALAERNTDAKFLPRETLAGAAPAIEV